MYELCAEILNSITSRNCRKSFIVKKVAKNQGEEEEEEEEQGEKTTKNKASEKREHFRK